jgi:hypothetical protein
MNAILALDADTTNVQAIIVARSSIPLAIQLPKSARVEL